MRVRPGDRRVSSEHMRLTLEIGARKRIIVGWLGIFVAAFVVLLIFWRTPHFSTRSFVAAYVVLAAPFGAVYLVGQWGVAWLRRSLKVKAAPVLLIDRIGCAFIFAPAKSTIGITGVLLVLGLGCIPFVH